MDITPEHQSLHWKQTTKLERVSYLINIHVINKPHINIFDGFDMLFLAFLGTLLTEWSK